jgi:hypothetical protein
MAGKSLSFQLQKLTARYPTALASSILRKKGWSRKKVSRHKDGVIPPPH